MSDPADAAVSPTPWPQRIMVLGSSGAGKTDLGCRLGEALGLPVIDLDDEYWQAGWVEPLDEWWTERQSELAAGERWVLSGNFGSGIGIRAQRADLVVLLELPRWLCLWRVLVRSLKIRLGRQIWRLPANCRAGPDWEPLRDYPEFLRYIWRFPMQSVRRAYTRLRNAGVESLIVLRSTDEVRALDTALTSTLHPSHTLRALEEPLSSAMVG